MRRPFGCPDADIRTRLNLGDNDGLIPFPSYNFSGPQRGSFLGSCQAIAADDAPCSLSGADAFTGDDSDFGSSMCAYTEQSTGPEAFCTYQPTAVYYWFKFFLCAFPGMCALLAAYPTYCKRHHFPPGGEEVAFVSQSTRVPQIIRWSESSTAR